VEPKIYNANEQGISQDKIDTQALYVITKLQQAGHQAYLVGGGVRDLLVNRTPKDYDISTSARPEEIKRIFPRNCLIIGRRFRLAHIRFGKKILEVSTFRAGDAGDDSLIIHDNEWGSPAEDAARRDFTINGLFYDPTHEKIIDYVGGCADVSKGVIRTIGVSDVRFRQDPVRMIRLLKFLARFDFEADEETMRSLRECREELQKSSPARVLEEMFKMLESGASSDFFDLMEEHKLLDLVFPWLARFLRGPFREDILGLLGALDQCVDESNGSLPDRSVQLACLLFPLVERELAKKFDMQNSPPHLGQIMELTTHLVEGIAHTSFPSFPRRIRVSCEYLMNMQYRLLPSKQKKSSLRPKMVQHYEFAFAIQFLKVRSMINPDLAGIYDEWKHVLEQAEQEVPDHRRTRRRHPRKHREGSGE
jgi:poly(A) polymerase